MWDPLVYHQPDPTAPVCLDNDSPIADLDHETLNFRLGLLLLYVRVKNEYPEGHTRLGVELDHDLHFGLQLFKSSLMVPYLDVGPLVYHQPDPTAPRLSRR